MIQTLEGVKITPAVDLVRHEPGGYTFSNLKGEGHTQWKCSCGELFEFFGGYNTGKDTIRLAMAQHIFLANQALNAAEGASAVAYATT